MTHILRVYAHGANHLEDVERFGKNDPYAQFTLNFNDKDSFQKTVVKKNAGKHVEWNQGLNIDNYEPNLNHTLYVEVLDKETTIDQPIGFTAIPLRQVINAPNQTLKGKFDLYDSHGKEKGTISLTISAVKPGQPANDHTSSPEVNGYTQVETEHLKRFKSMKNKEKAADAGTAAAILGGIFGAKALHDAHKKTGKSEP
ncbi:hypothetical protein BGX27_003167 [Mortierella sp. AM989]|nr:hypothetical protein BGX27_003167 [Mortierella sp. AM989]